MIYLPYFQKKHLLAIGKHDMMHMHMIAHDMNKLTNLTTHKNWGTSNCTRKIKYSSWWDSERVKCLKRWIITWVLIYITIIKKSLILDFLCLHVWLCLQMYMFTAEIIIRSLDIEKTKLERSKKEASPSAGEKTRVFLVSFCT